MNQEETEKINESLKEFELNQQTVKSQPTIDSSNVAKKAEEAFKEFELKQKAKHEQEQTLTPANLTALEIQKSLEEFEAKSKIEQQQKQSFESQKDPKDSKMVQLVIKLSGGLIKEERQAEYVLLGLAVLFFLTSVYFFFTGINGNKQKSQQPSAARLEQMKKNQNPQQSK